MVLLRRVLVFFTILNWASEALINSFRSAIVTSSKFSSFPAFASSVSETLWFSSSLSFFYKEILFFSFNLLATTFGLRFSSSAEESENDLEEPSASVVFKYSSWEISSALRFKLGVWYLWIILWMADSPLWTTPGKASNDSRTKIEVHAFSRMF